MSNDTICAIATAPGGALGIVRVSGDDAIDISARIFFPKNGKDLRSIQANRATFGTIKAGEQVIDEVVAIPFHAPHSYTGENSVEFSCHGSQYILSAVIQALLQNGSRLAQPGEYTKRAFLNGKIDLSQAEAVADVIAANTESYSRIAMSQLRGGLKAELEKLHTKILNLRSMLELELDFSDHDDLEFANRPQLLRQAEDIQSKLNELSSTFQAGNTIKEGIPVAIIGAPNVGKSTLMNALLKDDRAIVSDIPGTTRDTIEEKITISGIEFRFVDTAGLRETDDKIESLGIERTKSAIQKAKTIIYMISADDLESEDLKALRNIPAETPIIVVLNKIDLLTGNAIEDDSHKAKEKFCTILKHTPKAIIPISAKKETGIDKLRKTLVEIQGLSLSADSSHNIIVNKRHYEALSNASRSMANVIAGIKNGTPTELISLDLRQVDFDLSDINGATTSQEALNNIFAHFCIGK